MSRDPNQVFVVRSFTRAEIAKELNDLIDCEGLKIEPFKEDDGRLTDEVCESFANATEEAISEADEVVDREYSNHFQQTDKFRLALDQF